MHPLHVTHTQRVRSKLLTPVLCGGSPKSFNSIDNNNIKHCYKNCSITEKKIRQSSIVLPNINISMDTTET